MTTEKRLSALYSVLRSTEYGETVIKNPAQYAGCALPGVGEAADLLLDLLAELDAKSGKKNALAVAKQIVKSAKQHGNASIHGAARLADGFTYVCDGYVIFRFREDFAAVEHVAPETYINPAPFFDAETAPEPVQLPTVAELKSFIAEHGFTRAKYNTDKNYPVGVAFYNPFYLLDALTAFSGELTARHAYTQKGTISELSPLRISGENGDAYILPIRP